MIIPMPIQGEGSGTPLQSSCLENPRDRGAWRAAVHGLAEGWTRLSDFTFTFHFHALEKEMATHSSCLENPRAGGAWWTAVYGVAQSGTRLKRLSSSSSSSSHQRAKSVRALASASVLPMNIQGWLPLGLTGLISLLSKGLSRVFSSTTIQKHQFFVSQPSLWSNSHIHT